MRVLIRRRHHAFLPIEIYFPWKSPALFKCERESIFLQNDLGLHVPFRPSFRDEVIEELNPIEHASVIHGFVRDERLVDEAENLGDIVQIWMLSNECPLIVVNEVAEIDDGHLYAPVLFVVGLDVPVDPDGAHVLCAL